MMDRLFDNDTVLKILSVLAAIFLWLQVNGASTRSRPPEKQVSVGPLTLQWSPPNGSNLTVVSMHPSAVDVQLQGPSKALSSIKRGNVTAWVNLSKITRAGTYTLPIGASSPPGTTSISIAPAQVTVSLDQMGTRKLPVTVRAQGSPPAKYEVRSLVPEISRATISGPMQDLNRVKKVVATVPVEGHNANFQDQSMLLPVAGNGATVAHVEVTPPMASVAATIRLKPPEATVGVVVRISGHPAAGYTISRISVTPRQLTITGAKSVIGKISTVYTTPISVSGMTGPVKGSIPVSLPASVSAVNGNLVQVSIDIAPK